MNNFLHCVSILYLFSSLFNLWFGASNTRALVGEFVALYDKMQVICVGNVCMLLGIRCHLVIACYLTHCTCVTGYCVQCMRCVAVDAMYVLR